MSLLYAEEAENLHHELALLSHLNSLLHMENDSVLMLYMNTLSAVIPISVALREVREGKVSSQNHQSDAAFIYLDKTTWSRLGTKWTGILFIDQT